MRIRTIGLAVSLALGSSALMAGTVNFSAVGYAQYGDVQSYKLPIASYQFGYDVNDGPFIPALTPVKENILVAAMRDGAGRTERNLFGFSGNLSKLYSPPFDNSAGRFAQDDRPARSSELPSATPLITKGDSLLPLNSFLTDRKTTSTGPVVSSDYPTATPSLAAWSKEWITDTSDSIEADLQPLETPFLNASSLGTGVAPDANEGLVTFNAGVPGPVAGTADALPWQTGYGSVISSAYSRSGGSAKKGNSLSGDGSGAGPGLAGENSVLEAGPALAGGSSGGSKADDGSKKPDDGSKKPDDGSKKPDDGSKKPDDDGDPTYITPPDDGGPEGDDDPSKDPLPPPGGDKPDPLDPKEPEPPIKPTGDGDDSNQTPEPASLLLLGSALLGLSALRRRAKK